MQQTLPLAGEQATQPAVPLAVKNGTWTIRNRETGAHRTFRVRTQREDARFAPGLRVLSLLTGPNNEQDFTGFAFVEDDRVRVWNRKRGTQFDALATMFWCVATNAPTSILPGCVRWQDRYEFLGEARCLRCNRKLTEPVSIETGVGPECGGRR